MLTPVDGGYRLSGLWDFCSGIPYSTHLVCGARLRDADGPPKVVLRGGAAREATILDDWGGDQTLGMRASGSHSVEIKDVFVPAHHVGSDARPCSPARMTCATARRGHGCTAIRCISAACRGPITCRWLRRSIGAAGRARRISGHHPHARRRSSRRSSRAPSTRTSSAPSARRPVLTDAAENLMIRGGEVYMELCQRWASRRHADHGGAESAAVGDAAAGRPHGLRRRRAAVQERRARR